MARRAPLFILALACFHLWIGHHVNAFLFRGKDALRLSSSAVRRSPTHTHTLSPTHLKTSQRANDVSIANERTTPTQIFKSAKISSAEELQRLFSREDSPRVKVAKLRLAEVQGLLPLQFSDNLPPEALQDDKVLSRALLDPRFSGAESAHSEGDITWQVAKPHTKYDPQQSAHRFSASPWAWMKRSGQIFLPIGVFMMKIVLDRVTNQEEVNREFRARQLLHYLSAQSPALIKAGQSLSSRSDLLPKEYLQCMETLQDRCPSFPNAEAFAVFEEELGMKFEDVFELDNELPIAAASIGQVYKGRIKATGQPVAVKIQRPHCEQTISADLSILRWYGKRFQDLLGALEKNVDIVTIIDDFGDLLYREIDYRAEALNAQRFAELYADVPDVHVPKIFSHLSSKRVLVMEWVDGVRLTDKHALKAMGLDGTKLVNTLVQSTLRQMLEHGFFHADPHAGNLLAMPNGKLCYLDFGMVSFVEKGQRLSIIEAVIHMVNRDFVSLSHLFQRMGFLPADLDLQPIIVALERALPDVLSTPVSEFNFKNVLGKLGDVMYKFPFTLPPYYISIMKCLGVLEGLAMQVDKNFRIVNDAYPYIASRLLTDSSPELRSALLNLLFKDNKVDVDRLEDLLEHATGIAHFDVGLAVDQLLAHLATPAAKELRDSLAEQVVEGFDALESEVVELLLQHLFDPELAVSTASSLVFAALQSPKGSTALERLDQVLEKTLGLLAASEKETRVLRALIKAVRIGIRSVQGSSSPAASLGGLSAAKHTLAISRKIVREPVFRELVLSVLSRITEKTSSKIRQRVLGKIAQFKNIFNV